MPAISPVRAATTVCGVLDNVTIKGYKSLRSVDIELRHLNLLVGPNGAGKSNLIQAFAMLSAMLRQELQLLVGRAGGASTLLHRGTTNADRIEFELKFPPNGYIASLVPTDADALIFEREVATFKGWNHNRPYTEAMGVAHPESRLVEVATDRKVVGHVAQTIADWVVYHFHDTSRSSPMKQKGDIGDNERLRDDGSNLAAFLFRLRSTGPSEYGRIVDAVRLVAPFFDDFRLREDPINQQRIQLEWKQRGTTGYFNAHSLSDGTLRFICIATLLLQPKPPSLILLDEPELGLHPYAISLLADMLRTSECQSIVSTQSVTLLNQMDIGDVLIAEQRDGETHFDRPSAKSLEHWFDTYALGELWEKNLIGGRPVQR